MIKFKELAAMPPAELREKFLELKKELIRENAQVAIGTVPKNPRKIRHAKKTIAKIEMILARTQTKPADQQVAAPKGAAQK